VFLSADGMEMDDTEKEQKSYEECPKTEYTCHIELSPDDGVSPWFIIESSEFKSIGKTIVQCWSQILKRLKAQYGGVITIPGIRHLTGFEFFGLADSRVKEMIDRLPGADKVKKKKEDTDGPNEVTEPKVTTKIVLPGTLSTPIKEVPLVNPELSLGMDPEISESSVSMLDPLSDFPW
jgi:hypothetical protein